MRDSFTGQGMAAGAGDPLVGSGGAASTAGDLSFPHAQVRPYGRSMGSARATGTGKPRGNLEVPVLLRSSARPGDDSRAAWSEVGSLRDRRELIRSLGRVLCEHSSHPNEQGRAHRADSIVLRDSATTLANSRMLRANSRALRARIPVPCGPRP